MPNPDLSSFNAPKTQLSHLPQPASSSILSNRASSMASPGGSSSPSAAAIGGGAVASHGEKAEAIIERARLEKSKMPVYEGLPDYFVLLEKMGE